MPKAVKLQANGHRVRTPACFIRSRNPNQVLCVHQYTMGAKTSILILKITRASAQLTKRILERMSKEVCPEETGGKGLSITKSSPLKACIFHIYNYLGSCKHMVGDRSTPLPRCNVDYRQWAVIRQRQPLAGFVFQISVIIYHCSS